MTEQFNYCHVVGKTDVGRKRASNEDSMGNAITINGLVAVVCDGMGGHVGGATASKIAVNTILDNLNTNYYDDPRIAIGESIDIANQAVLREADAHPELLGMGSTCVLVIVRSGKVYIGHVGDSRIYLIRSKKIVQLTKDHSYVQMLVDRGEITKDQAEHHPRKNEITNALGISNMTPATVADDAIIPEAGDCFLLCSDGLSGMVSNDVICKVVSRQSEMNAQDRVDRLIALANENGGIDNITVQMVEFPVAPGIIKHERKIPAWLKILFSSLLVVAFGLGTYMLFKENKSDDQPEPESKEEASFENNGVIEEKFTFVEKVSFIQKGELLTLSFSDNSVIFNHGEKNIYSQSNVALNPSTLTVENANIEVSLKAPSYILKFTDVFPGDKVIFTIESSDKKKVYKYTVNISNSKSLSPELRAEKSKDSLKDNTPNEVDSVKIELRYTNLNQGTDILINYFIKEPEFLLNGKKVGRISNSFDEVKFDDIKYDDKKWTVCLISNHKQLKFTAKEESSIEKYYFEIPCFLTGTTTEIILKVQLSPESSDASKSEIDENDKHDGTES